MFGWMNNLNIMYQSNVKWTKSMQGRERSLNGNQPKKDERSQDFELSYFANSLERANTNNWAFDDKINRI